MSNPAGQGSKGQYVCVDPVGLEGLVGSRSFTFTSGGTDAKLGLVGIHCDNLPCPPYSAAVALNCAQCTSEAAEVGDVFVQWGRSSCTSATSSLLYPGIAVTHSKDDGGGGTDTICLPLSKESSLPSQPLPLGAPELYAINFETNNGGVSFASLHGLSIHCAVCQSNTAGSTTFMQSANDVCPSGFNTEYRGYIMASRDRIDSNHQKQHWICMDVGAEEGSSRIDDNQPWLFLAQLVVSILPSPPYTHLEVFKSNKYIPTLYNLKLSVLSRRL